MDQLQPSQPNISTDRMTRFISFLDSKEATIASYSRSLRLFFGYLASNQITKLTRADFIHIILNQE